MAKTRSNLASPPASGVIICATPYSQRFLYADYQKNISLGYMRTFECLINSQHKSMALIYNDTFGAIVVIYVQTGIFYDTSHHDGLYPGLENTNHPIEHPINSLVHKNNVLIILYFKFRLTQFYNKH